MPTVGEQTEAAVARLKQIFPEDEWIGSLEELVKHDKELDKKAKELERLSANAQNN